MKTYYYQQRYNFWPIMVAMFGASFMLAAGIGGICLQGRSGLDLGAVGIILFIGLLPLLQTRKIYVDYVLRPKNERLIFDGAYLIHIDFNGREDARLTSSEILGVSQVTFMAGDSTKRWEITGRSKFIIVRCTLSRLSFFWKDLEEFRQHGKLAEEPESEV
ncbi:MAG: hypothetical protein JSS72_13415 [Armatimonadetes bacterium]|nr:hypothetical protein [Armatimonadota bacterium]